MEANKTMDTICAVSTPPGVGGVALVRLSGGAAKEVAEKLLRTPHGKAVVLKDHKAQYAHLYDDRAFVDDVVATFFAAPHSYTGEDVVEISCHGSVYVQQRLLQVLIDNGTRLAEAGEFTLRAFMNRRLDLSQAEAVADLIESRSETAHRLAVSQMRGGYAQELEKLRQELIDLAALLELELDFSDEDLQFASREHLKDTVGALSDKVARLVASFQTGNALKEGIPVAIVGRPNAGKSSLLNALVAEERAIVSDIPGTTRDTVEESMTIDGIRFRFIDTAGLRQSDDPIESLGFDRAIKAAQQARFILFVRDMSVPFDENACEDISYITDRCDMKDKHLFIVHNKCDMPHNSTPQGIVISAKQRTGIDELKRDIAAVARKEAGQNDGILLTNSRHYEAMKHVLSALGEVRKSLEVGLSSDLVVVDIRDALYHLGTITGKVTTDEVLSSVFSRFCIGK